MTGKLVPHGTVIGSACESAVWLLGGTPASEAT